MPRVAILISGGGSNMLALVSAMQSGAVAAEPALVLSNRPDAGGLARAAALGVPTAVVDHKPFKGDREAFDAAVQAELRACGADIVCLAGFMRILTPGFIAPWEGRMLNIHPSLLPLFRGLHTHERALDAGMAVHGCTVHEVTAELDGGPIRGQAVIAVTAEDTPDSLAARLLPMEHRLYPAVLAQFVRGDRTPLALFG
ncbi:phosphoribosylglycinamide formyltransferase [Paroceanicella profunda]|uniref:Phosphoribosylglycinamide formyltransferase n=1 Tax=Paroceanicella profunda TaxID=2579971 RepID=A0A5B8FJ09_9RHOB|nr:phosphoribosylglycinamide formyltransferase [Paroceanicella profunda]QDL93708.1 phosphoribosylglycinamide formyltransferase [Paroceanicella profunda]